MELSVDYSSQAAYYIDCLFNEVKLANGTAFFVKRNDQLYLLTNWHNVTGRNPLTGDYLSTNGAIPNRLLVHVFKNQDYLEWETLSIPLLDEEDNNLWLEHPLHRQKVDVVALQVALPDHLLVTPVEDTIEPFNENTPVHVGNDVFILGYPFGITAGGKLPIWKRASIASEPAVDTDGVPKILVDTASRPGMSGSPVIPKELLDFPFPTK
jgi:hypothetical protein